MAEDYDKSIGAEKGSRYSLIHDKNCIKCRDEHLQLAEWLKELKVVHEEIDDMDDESEIFVGYLRRKMKGA